MYVIVMSEMFSKYVYIIIFFHLQLIQRNKNNWPPEQKYVLQDLHRKQVHVSSVPRHCVPPEISRAIGDGTETRPIGEVMYVPIYVTVWINVEKR